MTPLSMALLQSPAPAPAQPVRRGPFGALRDQTARNLRVQEGLAALFGEEARSPREHGATEPQ